MRYNNLESQLKTLAKFVFIYESHIKQISKEADFKELSTNALNFFKKSLQKNMKYANDEEIRSEKTSNRQTLLFTKSKVQILDFCRHLRNSFCHGIISKDGCKLNIADKNRRKETSKGFLDYDNVIVFIKHIINDFEEKDATH